MIGISVYNLLKHFNSDNMFRGLAKPLYMSKYHKVTPALHNNLIHCINQPIITKLHIDCISESITCYCCLHYTNFISIKKIYSLIHYSINVSVCFSVYNIDHIVIYRNRNLHGIECNLMKLKLMIHRLVINKERAR